jgi:hypothetical protein
MGVIQYFVSVLSKDDGQGSEERNAYFLNHFRKLTQKKIEEVNKLRSD